MSLGKILKKIIDDAQEEADRIIKEGKKKAKEIRKDAEKEAEQLADVLFREEERQGQLEAGRLITQERLQKKIKILSSKKELINEVLDKAFQSENLNKEQLKKIIIFKDEEKEEDFDETKLKHELRPKLENYIAEILGI